MPSGLALEKSPDHKACQDFGWEYGLCRLPGRNARCEVIFGHFRLWTGTRKGMPDEAKQLAKINAWKSTLGELSASTGTAESVLLAFFHTAVAGEHAAVP